MRWLGAARASEFNRWIVGVAPSFSRPSVGFSAIILNFYSACDRVFNATRMNGSRARPIKVEVNTRDGLNDDCS
jgi:hypothetical protein